MAVRRSISLTLCWLLLLPSLFAMRAPVKPECCLRNGVHHCAGTMDGMRMEGDGDSVRALNTCPYNHSPSKLRVSTFAVAVPLQESVALMSAAAAVRERVRKFKTAVMERASRGPPARLAAGS